MDYGLGREGQNELSAENFEKSSCFTLKTTRNTLPMFVLSSFKHL